MKLLFVHSGEKVKQDEKGNLYVDGAYSKEVFKRYLDICDELTVVFRKDKKIYKEEYAKKEFEPFSNNIKFIEYLDRTHSIKNYFNLKIIRTNKENIEKQVIENDKIIVRLPCTAGYEAAKYAKKHKKSYMAEIVGCIWDALWNFGIKGKALALSTFLKMKKATRDAKYVVYVTNKFLQNRYPNKFFNIGCSDVSIPEFDDDILQKRKEKIKKMKNIKKISIATVGAINVKYKGQKYVLNAIKELERQGYDITYYIIGGGDKSYLSNIINRKKIESNIKFLGAVTHEKVFQYMDNVDIYIQPSNLEGLPRAVIEAMSRACPVIVSNAGGNTELIENKKFIFKKKSVKQLVKCIKQISKEDMLKEAERNYQKAQNYQKELLEEKRKTFYEKFVNANS